MRTFVVKLCGIKSGLLLSVCLILLICGGCQQTKMTFTQVQSPVTPSFKPLINAPKIESSSDSSQVEPHFAPQVSVLAPFHHLHILPGRLSALNRIHLVAISPNQPYQDADILVKAFHEKGLWLANKASAKTPLNCIESFKPQVNLHSITLTLACPDNQLETALSLLIDTWSADSFSDLDIAKLSRQLALDKHINAFNGNEIEKLWAEKILGKNHPYNSALNNESQQKTLTHKSLEQITHQAANQSQWHLIIERDAPIEPQQKTVITAQMKRLPVPSNFSKPKQDNFKPYGKTLYVIDAPGSVQTQVRLGYHLPLQVDDSHSDQMDSTFNCELLSRWLGRSFSGRLYYDLRERRGLTYGIYGRCFDNPMATILKYYGSTQLQHTGAFIKGILDHLQLAQTELAENDEIKALADYYQNQFNLMFDDPAHRTARYIQLLSKHQEWQAIVNQQAQWQQLNPLILKQTAQQVFNAPPVMVIRGDLDKITPDLQDKLPDWQIITP
ncbi:M16 family metallopeptidase [Shewanella psychrotolerans]|uniref:M16 family metallopeptidase n=1 Tax=Shewanella psychrotolerans TaxID=2864206 RepID=UPI001C6608E5|nr:insulinase family protein [Shewanella psychrotolerans]QYK02001.1 insulinase family protein [Shewanella psychrotolerans]